MADYSDLADWIRLDSTQGVGPATARTLLAHFGLPAAIFAAELPALRQVVPEAVARALLSPPSSSLLALIDRTLTWLDEPGNAALTLADADYPPSLLSITDPPLLLYAKGRIDLLKSRPALAIVGSRNATRQGRLNAECFAESFGQSGWTVVSGMALGIDTAAHEGSLRAADAVQAGSTIAVIGTGVDIVYPARNRTLAHQIAEQGCLLSEYVLGTPAIAANFPRRNRLISGLSRGVLVVEAAEQSGSLITARTALEQGREVFAIPGSIHSPLAKGCHQLIKQGAKLVESAQDVLEEFGAWAKPVAKEEVSRASSEFDTVLTAMGFDPVHIDVLAASLRIDMAKLSSQLLHMELAGTIEMMPGGDIQAARLSSVRMALKGAMHLSYVGCD
jgi:DNA processing protein